MYDSNRSNKKSVPITMEEILTKVSEYDIYSAYIGRFNIGHIYNSPFRKDKNPSFGVFRSKKTGELLFKDHGSGICGNVIKFVSTITGLTNYNDILNRIVTDLRITNNTVLNVSRQPKETGETIIGVVRQDFTKTDLEYWQTFGIKKKTLEKFNVDSIKYYLCNGIVKGIYKPDNPMFSYKVFNKFKIYRPLGNKYTKWRNNLSEYDIQGYEQLPETGDLLIITKSLKDVMVLYEMGYNAISPSSESTFIPDKALKVLKKRFKRVIINFDRDIPGVRYMRSISLKTGLHGLLIHKSFNSKDISDAVKTNGFEKIKTWIKKEIG